MESLFQIQKGSRIFIPFLRCIHCHLLTTLVRSTMNLVDMPQLELILVMNTKVLRLISNGICHHLVLGQVMHQCMDCCMHLDHCQYQTHSNQMQTEREVQVMPSIQRHLLWPGTPLHRQVQQQCRWHHTHQCLS